MLKRYYIKTIKTLLFYLSNLFLFSILLGHNITNYEQIKWICCFWSILFSISDTENMIGYRSNLIPIPNLMIIALKLIMDLLFIIIPLNLCNFLIECSIQTPNNYNSIQTFLLSSLNQVILINLINYLTDKLPTLILPILLIPFGIPTIIFSIYQENQILSCLIIFYFILYLPATYLFFRRNG